MYRTEKASFGNWERETGFYTNYPIVCSKKAFKAWRLKVNLILHIYIHLLTSSELNVSLGP